MKRRMALVLALALMFTAAGCGSKEEKTAENTPAIVGANDEKTEESEAEPLSTDFPTGKIELIVPLAVGGGSDLVARILAAQVEADLGVPVVCTNVEGGGTSIGLQQLADSEPDGYTIGMTMTNMATLQALGYSDLSYKDFESICCVNYDAATIMIRTDDDRFSDLDGLVAYAKEHPGELNWGTGSAGGMWHMAILKFCDLTGIEVNVIPNPGGSSGVGLTLANGDIDAVVFSPVDTMTQIDSGEIIPICSMTDERMASFPDVPTCNELGYEIEIYSTRGFIAPKGTPAEVIDVLEASFKKAVESDAFKEFIESQSSNIRWLSSEDYEKWMIDEVDQYVPILEEAGLAQ